MKHRKMLLIVMMVLPWLSMPFVGKQTFKRFYPGALFIGAWICVERIIAQKRVWWKVYERLMPNVMGELPFIVGPFFVGSLWILKFTFGKFSRYLLVNFITDFLFAYPGMFVLRKLGIASLVRLKHYQFLTLFMTKAVIMYGFQGTIEKLRSKPKSLFQKIFS